MRLHIINGIANDYAAKKKQHAELVSLGPGCNGKYPEDVVPEMNKIKKQLQRDVIAAIKECYLSKGGNEGLPPNRTIISRLESEILEYLVNLRKAKKKIEDEPLNLWNFIDRHSSTGMRKTPPTPARASTSRSGATQTPKGNNNSDAEVIMRRLMRSKKNKRGITKPPQRK